MKMNRKCCVFTQVRLAWCERSLTVRVNRCEGKGKSKVGRPVWFVNNRWCEHGDITVQGKICCQVTELLVDGLRQYVLQHTSKTKEMLVGC